MSIRRRREYYKTLLVAHSAMQSRETQKVLDQYIESAFPGYKETAEKRLKQDLDALKKFRGIPLGNLFRVVSDGKNV